MTVSISKPSINIREKLSEIPPLDKLVNKGDDISKLSGIGRKNLIINGDFRISQRGDYDTAPVAVVNYGYLVDRWLNRASGITATVQRTSVIIDGVAKKAMKYVATSTTTGYLGAHQRIEIGNINIGSTVTLSCKIRSNHPKAGLRMEHIGGVDGDGPQKHSGSGQWENFSWTLDTTGTNPAEVEVSAYAIIFNSATTPIQSGDYIEIADFQLEIGPTATDFEYRSFGEELALCQRYYEKSFNYVTAPTNGSSVTSFSHFAGLVTGISTNTVGIGGHCSFLVEKRATPTMTRYGNSDGHGRYILENNTDGWALNAFNFSYIGTKSFMFRQQQLSSTFIISQAHWTADAEL